MINNFLEKKIQENFNFEPTSGQRDLILLLANFILNPNDNSIFLLKGYAGTGKTSIVSALVKALNSLKNKTILLAPTGRAAKVFSSYSQNQAYTIHKKIYRQKSSNDGFGKFSLDRNLSKDTLFIVDEASMISNQSNDVNIFGNGRLLEDLIYYVYGSSNNCKLILLGDTAQLPPVGINLSPALDKKEVEKYGFEVTAFELTEVLRQTEKSGILLNANYLRTLISDISKLNKYPKFITKNFKDIERISGEELIDSISNSYDKVGINETLIITRSNDRANRYNQGIRNSILWREEEICQGDILMVVKNNYFWTDKSENIDFIANGDTFEILKIYRYENIYGFRFADVKIRLLDYDNLEFDVKILLDVLSMKSAALNNEEAKKLYTGIVEDYPEIRTKKALYEKIKEDKYFNALQVKFAYAVTCHKSQGGQWKNVFIDQGYITDEMIDIEYLRWLYTAFTRATEKVYLINFKDDYFE